MPSPRVFLALLAAAVAMTPAAAVRPREQDTAFRQAQRGRIMPLRQIEQRVREHPMAQGVTRFSPQFDEAETRYRLTFMQKNGRVAWIDVDARNGRVLQTSGD